MDTNQNQIDCSYPEDQFRLQGDNMYHRDRTKEGGGLIAYFCKFIP